MLAPRHVFVGLAARGCLQSVAPRVARVPAVPRKGTPVSRFCSASSTSSSSTSSSPSVSPAGSPPSVSGRSLIRQALAPKQQMLAGISEYAEAQQLVIGGNLSAALDRFQRSASIVAYANDPALAAAVRFEVAAVGSALGRTEVARAELGALVDTQELDPVVRGGAGCALAVALLRSGDFVQAQTVLAPWTGITSSGTSPAEDELRLSAAVISAWAKAAQAAQAEQAELFSKQAEQSEQQPGQAAPPPASDSRLERFAEPLETLREVSRAAGVDPGAAAGSQGERRLATDPVGADALHSLARLHQWCGDYARAGPLFQRAGDLYLETLAAAKSQEETGGVSNETSPIKWVFPFMPAELSLAQAGEAAPLDAALEFAEASYAAKHPRLASILRLVAVRAHRGADAITAEGLFRHSQRLLGPQELPARFRNTARARRELQLTVAAYAGLLAELEWNGQSRRAAGEALRQQHGLEAVGPSAERVSMLAANYGWMQGNAPELLADGGVAGPLELEWLEDRYGNVFQFELV